MEKNNLSFHTPRKRHQNEHVRVPSRSPHIEPTSVQTSNYNQNGRPPSESRQSTMTYHKPVRENSHHTVGFSKLPMKTRGNLKKTRGPHSGIQQQQQQHQQQQQQQQQQQHNNNITTITTNSSSNKISSNYNVT
ncbi:GATA zinc finger domain-containing protein 10-like [Polistes fuscatus]|uniref:GATA zinc finger domain-containing protein 10-like n=1 Tax=Polistes fuscatus TaxID=30207 RepID=UPI001CA96692|nr:GATA zinc finger domain-containing protein 10-like [Polistes fuscatus]